MVPFSFYQALLKSRVMKERSLPSSPLTGVKRTTLPIFFISPNWVQHHAGLVGQTCRFAPIKKSPDLPMLPSKNPHEPNLFPEIQPPYGTLHFLSVFICVHPWLKNPVRFQ